jgi:hypothetical protein
MLVTTHQDFTMKPFEVEPPVQAAGADCKESLPSRQAPETTPPESVARLEQLRKEGLIDG